MYISLQMISLWDIEDYFILGLDNPVVCVVNLLKNRTTVV